MLALARFYRISPLELERIPAWLLEEMNGYALRVQAEERRQAGKARRG